MNIKEKFALLTRLPLMQGISGKDLAMLEESLGLEVENFLKMNTPIIEQGEINTQLVFLAQGRIQRTHRVEGTGISLTSWIEAPCVLEPENMYGLNPRYDYTYTLEENVKLICVSKANVNRCLMKNEIFRLNMLNYISALIQKNSWHKHPSYRAGTREKVESVLNCWFYETNGKGEIEYKMTDLADYIGETRLNTSKVLNAMEEEGKVELKRGKIILK